jgi:tetratricopeptide (TPR) repeat protein
MKTRFAAAAAVTLLVVSLPAAQQPEPRGARPGWDVWLNAIHTHEPGVRDRAVEDVAPWSMNDLQVALESVAHQSPAAQLRVVTRGLVLHADIAILHRVDDGYDLPSSGLATTLVKDGRRVGQMGSTVHWEFARRLIDALPRTEERTRLGRQFYRAAGAVLQEWGEFPELTRHLGAGRRVLGDDSVLFLYEGTQQQAYSGPKLQQFRAQRLVELARRPSGNLRAGVLPAPLRQSTLIPPAAEARRQAERLFRRALALDPTLVEARIRLAHVLSDLEKQDEAAAEIEAAMKTPLPALLEYYGSLVLGRVQRARQQLDAARAAFERAAAVLPEAPAPKFGLSDVAMARGDRAESLELLPRETVPDALEPWWSTERMHEPSAAKLLDELHREAKKP